MEWVLVIFLLVQGQSAAIGKIEGFPTEQACNDAWNKILKDRAQAGQAGSWLNLSCVRKK